MEVIWSNPPITIKRVLHFLNQKNSYAYTTVMTVMNRLVNKNILKRDKKSHSFTYTALISKKDFLENAAEEIVSSLMNDYLDITINTINRTEKAEKSKKTKPARKSNKKK